MRRYKYYVINGRRLMKNAVSVAIGIGVACGIITGARLGNIRVDVPKVQEKVEKAEK